MSIRERRRTEQLNIRVTPEELTTIRLAAERAAKTITELVVSATLDKIQADGLGFRGTLRKLTEDGA